MNGTLEGKIPLSSGGYESAGSNPAQLLSPGACGTELNPLNRGAVRALAGRSGGVRGTTGRNRSVSARAQALDLINPRVRPIGLHSGPRRRDPFHVCAPVETFSATSPARSFRTVPLETPRPRASSETGAPGPGCPGRAQRDPQPGASDSGASPLRGPRSRRCALADEVVRIGCRARPEIEERSNRPRKIEALHASRVQREIEPSSGFIFRRSPMWLGPVRQKHQ